MLLLLMLLLMLIRWPSARIVFGQDCSRTSTTCTNKNSKREPKGGHNERSCKRHTPGGKQLKLDDDRKRHKALVAGPSMMTRMMIWMQAAGVTAKASTRARRLPKIPKIGNETISSQQSSRITDHGSHHTNNTTQHNNNP